MQSSLIYTAKKIKDSCSIMALRAIKQLWYRIQGIPLIGPALCFPFCVVKRALIELFFLWAISSFPVFLTAIVKILQGVALEKVLDDTVNIKEIFLYSSAFLAPAAYMFAERIVYPKQKAFRGAVGISLLTTVLLIFSAFAFGNEALQTLPVACSLTVYFLSIYCWFLSIADSRNAFDYQTEAAQEEDTFSAMAAKRIRE